MYPLPPSKKIYFWFLVICYILLYYARLSIIYCTMYKTELSID